MSNLSAKEEEEIAYLKRRAESLGYRLVRNRKLKVTHAVFPNFGKSWSDEDLDYITNALEGEVPLKDMVSAVGRSPGSILGKLATVGKLIYDNDQRGYIHMKKKGAVSKMYMTYLDLKTLEKKYG